jgi:hypothetical protein
MYILYKTTNTINGKYYIGVSNGNDPFYKGSGTALKEAFASYGRSNFSREVLEIFDNASDAYARESEIVNEEFVKNRDTYNIKVGGKGGTGQLKSDTHKKNLSIAIKQKYNTDPAYREKSKNAGRKPAMNNALLVSYVEQFGIKSTADKLGLTLYQCRDRYYRAKSK